MPAPLAPPCCKVECLRIKDGELAGAGLDRLRPPNRHPRYAHYSEQLGSRKGSTRKKYALTASGSTGRCDEISRCWPFEQVARQNSLEAIPIAKCKPRPQPGHFGPPFKSRMAGEQIGRSRARKETNRFHLFIGDTMKSSIGCEDFDVAITQVDGWIHDALKRITAKAIQEGAFCCGIHIATWSARRTFFVSNNFGNIVSLAE